MLVLFLLSLYVLLVNFLCDLHFILLLGLLEGHFLLLPKSEININLDIHTNVLAITSIIVIVSCLKSVDSFVVALLGYVNFKCMSQPDYELEWNL